MPADALATVVARVSADMVVKMTIGIPNPIWAEGYCGGQHCLSTSQWQSYFFYYFIYFRTTAKPICIDSESMYASQIWLLYTFAP